MGFFLLCFLFQPNKWQLPTSVKQCPVFRSNVQFEMNQSVFYVEAGFIKGKQETRSGISRWSVSHPLHRKRRERNYKCQLCLQFFALSLTPSPIPKTLFVFPSTQSTPQLWAEFPIFKWIPHKWRISPQGCSSHPSPLHPSSNTP